MKIYFFLLVLLLPATGFSQHLSKDLQQKITETLSGQKGVYAVACKDLTTGESLLVNANESFHAASTMKTPVMVEVYKQASEGKFSLTDSITVKNEFKSIVDGSLYSQDSVNDSSRELYKHIGEKVSVHDLVYDMIIASSNFATNLVIDLVDPKNVMTTMRQLGAKDIRILRGVEDTRAFQKGLNNTVTAFDLMLIFEQMASGKLINQGASDDMIKILLDQKFNSMIPAKLPSNVKVAHKTGSIVGVQHDSGIVFLPDGRKYVLVLLSKDWDNKDVNTEILAGISKTIWDALK